MKVSILIDYDNLLQSHKTSGVLDVVTKILINLPKKPNMSIHGECDIRIYGGWYEKENMTQLAQDISVEIQNDFPAIIRLLLSEDKQIALRTTAELAVALAIEPSHHLFHTLRKKKIPSNIRIESVNCSNEECPLPIVKKLIQKKGRCPKNGCNNRVVISKYTKKSTP